MVSKVMPVAAVTATLVGLVVSTSAMAQSVASIGGPRELPPAGYTQQQYIDSRGCVFLRAGLGGNVTWVPRVGPDRGAMCGYPPTFATAREASAELDAQAEAPATTLAAVTPTVPAPAPSARPATVASVGAPLPSPITNARPAGPVVIPPVPSPQALAAANPLAAPAARPTAAPATGNNIACYKSAPVLERVTLSDGGSVLVCTKGDGSLTGWRAPVVPGKPRVGATLTPPPAQKPAAPVAIAMAEADPAPQPAQARRNVVAHSAQPIPGGTRVATGLPVPAGYVTSWEDDRLNPMRGLGTPEGQAAQDRVWTRHVPAEAVTVPDGNRLVLVAMPEAPATGRVTMSSKSEPAVVAPAPQAVGVAYVQVGAFAEPANAERAISRLSSVGVSVSSQTGRGMKVVLAGPFQTRGDAAAALGTIRSAGFPDAFLR